MLKTILRKGHLRVISLHFGRLWKFKGYLIRKCESGKCSAVALLSGLLWCPPRPQALPLIPKQMLRLSQKALNGNSNSWCTIFRPPTSKILFAFSDWCSLNRFVCEDVFCDVFSLCFLCSLCSPCFLLCVLDLIAIFPRVWMAEARLTQGNLQIINWSFYHSSAIWFYGGWSFHRSSAIAILFWWRLVSSAHWLPISIGWHF